MYDMIEVKKANILETINGLHGDDREMGLRTLVFFENIDVWGNNLASYCVSDDNVKDADGNGITNTVIVTAWGEVRYATGADGGTQKIMAFIRNALSNGKRADKEYRAEILITFIGLTASGHVDDAYDIAGATIDGYENMVAVIKNIQFAKDKASKFILS